MMQQKQVWYAHGKLLISGEYLVMHGARALAVPVNRGQYLKIVSTNVENGGRLRWTALKPDGFWFQAEYLLPGLKILNTTDKFLARKLVKILTVTRSLSPGFLNGRQNIEAETRLEFNTEFGLGSSSTLVANLAVWAGVDAYTLQRKALGGSGYDVACAREKGPVFYQLTDDKPVVGPAHWLPPFRDKVYFVYLGQKQRSDESIERFKKRAVYGKEDIRKISAIGQALVKAQTLDIFENLLRQHEEIMSAVLGILPVKERLFKEHQGVVKSLGAWGGDFVMATCHDTDEVFRRQMVNRGFNTMFSWDELVLKK